MKLIHAHRVLLYLLRWQFSTQRLLDEVTLWCWHSSLGLVVNLLLHDILHSAQRHKDAWRHPQLPRIP